MADAADADVPWWLAARRRPPKSYWYLVIAVVGFYALYLYAAIAICIVPLFDAEQMLPIITALAVLVLLSGISYVRALLTNPGVVRRVQADFVGVEAGQPALLDYQKMNYCAICDLYKPPRTHHCRRCNRCVMKMDHHCLWINNCVGFYNHKFFFLFVLYAWLCFLFLLVLYVYRWSRALLALSAGSVERLDTRDLVVLAISTALIAGHLVTVGYMLCFHTFLISRGRTNVEHSCCQGQAPSCNYDAGSVFSNWRAAFGSRYYDWWLPTRPPLDRPMWERRTNDLADSRSEHLLTE
jgi:palmitoyltransferase